MILAGMAGTSRGGGNDAWEHIDSILDVDGVKAVITRHKKYREKWAVSLKQEFDRQGLVDETIWIDYPKLAKATKVLEMAKKKIEELKAAEFKRDAPRVIHGGR